MFDVVVCCLLFDDDVVVVVVVVVAIVHFCCHGLSLKDKLCEKLKRCMCRLNEFPYFGAAFTHVLDARCVQHNGTDGPLSCAPHKVVI